MVNRKEEQGNEAIATIKDESGSDALIEWKECDLGDLKMVQKVFGGLAEDLDRLDYVRTSSVSAARLLLKQIAYFVFGNQRQPVPH
jgi:hypothetical protein